MTLVINLPFADPTVEEEDGSAPSSVAKIDVPLRPLPEKPVIGLIDNGKHKAKLLLTCVGDALVASGAAERYVIHSKRSFEPIDAPTLEKMLAEAHVVISAVGDCGGCTASSTTDALRGREQGVPAFVIATTKFKFLVEATDSTYAIGGLNKLYVEHPIWSRDDAWFAATGKAIADEVLAVLRSETKAETAAAGAPAAAGLDLGKIDGSLGELRSGMDADGYDMDVRVEGDSLSIDVSARPGAGKACLMPRDTFVECVASVLSNAGFPIPRERIRVRYPEQATA